MDQLLVLLAVVFVAARLGAELAERLHQPAVVGEILAGVLVGPAVLGWVPAHNQVLEALAELGVIFLLFTAGLETDLDEMRRVGGTAMAVAVGGVVLPFALGWGLMVLIGRSGPEALFTGTAMVATSVGVTARVLRDRGWLGTREARIILGAAVVDDVLALLLLAVVSAGVTEGGRSWSQIGLLAAEAAAFMLVLATLGRRTLQRVLPFLGRLKVTEPVLAAAIAIALVLAASAAKIGLAAIVGAFLAGVVVATAGDEHELEEKFQPLSTFLVPFFFVHVGTLVELEPLSSPAGLALTGAITVLALLGKIAGSGLAAARLGRGPAAIVGVGMAPRGEVGIIVASLGLGLGVIQAELYGVVVAMSLITTLVAPPLLVVLYRRAELADRV